MSRIRNAIRVLMGQKTTEEQVLESELRLMTARLEIADGCREITEGALNVSRKTRKRDQEVFEHQRAKLSALLRNRREKVHDLKRIIGTMKKKENEG